MTEETSEKKVDLEVGLNPTPPPSIGYLTGNASKPSELNLNTMLNDKIDLHKREKEFAQKQRKEKEKDKERSKRDTKANEKEKHLNEREKHLNEKGKSLKQREYEAKTIISDAESKATKIVSDYQSEAIKIISDAESEAIKIVSDAEKRLVKAKKVLSDSEANKVANDKNLESINNQLQSFSDIKELLEDMATNPLDISELKELLKADTKKQNKKSDKTSDSESKTTEQTSLSFDSPYDKIVKNPYPIYMKCKGSSKCSKMGVLLNPKQIIRSLSNGNRPKLEVKDEDGNIEAVAFDKLSPQNQEDFKKLLKTS